jgi:hypothetical protein
MATIDAKKLLPPSKKTAAIEKQKFLVPLQNISVNKKPAGDLRPVDKETKSSEDLSIVKKKISQLSLLLNESYLIEKKDREARRKAEERRKSEQREKNIEKKVKKNQVSSNLLSSIPGQSIFDTINRFIGFTLLGYLFNNYGKILPKLLEFGSVLKPVGEFFESFAKNLLKGAVDFVEFGYKAYDQTRDFVKQIGGEGAQKTFDEFSKNLNLLLNGAIAASMLIISTSPGRPGRPGRPGPGGPGRMPGGKPPTLPRNAKLSSYLGRDAQTKLIERRYGNDAARMYEARKSQGASASRARADVLKRFDKIEGPQRGLAGGTGKGSILSRGFGRSANRASLKVLGKTGTKIAKGAFGRVPIIGGLLDFAFSLAMGENPGRAAAKAVGATVGSALGTFIPIPFAGTILGGILGDIVGGALYDSLAGSKKPEGRAEGGQISGGSQKSVAPSRRIKTTTRKAPPRIQPQKTQPGKDVGGKLKIEELYGKDEPGTKSALRALRKSSEDAKKIKSINGLVGSMFGAGIDMALGQKPDKNLSRNIGNIFGSVISSAIDMELNKSFGDISKTIAMAGGGVVPSREIGRQLSIGERIGRFISRALAISIESSATRILQNLRNEMNLEGDGTGDGPGPGDGDGGPDVFYGTGAERMWNFFKNKGLSDFAVAGILGNARWESSFNPTARGKGMGPGGSDAIGIFQWGETERWKDLVNWAKSKNLNPWDYDTQLQFAWHEMQTTEKATIPAIQAATSASEAAEKFRSVYERSRNTEQRRKDAAEGYYKQYKGKTYIPPTPPTPRGPSTGYRPKSPGLFNAVEYITGDPSQGSNYDLAGHGTTKNYHDHIAFATIADKERAKSALRAAGIVIGSELRPGDPGYHGRNLAIDIPGAQWGGTGAIGQKEYNGSAKVRRVLGLIGTSQARPPQAPKPPAASGIAAAPGTKVSFNGTTFFKGTNGKYYKMGRGNVPVEVDKRTYDSAKSGGTLISSLQQRPPASLAPSQSSAVASLNRSGVLETDTGNMYGVIQTNVIFQEIITQDPMQVA